MLNFAGIFAVGSVMVAYRLTGFGTLTAMVILQTNLESLEDAVEDVYRIIKPKLEGTAYAIFGHSMGSMIAYELGHRLRELGCRTPRHLFFSGRGAPNVAKQKKVIHRLPDAEFVTELRKLQGTPEEVLNHAELLQVILPVIRSDFKIVELYAYREHPQKLTGDISIFNGNEDDITLEELVAWRDHTLQKCKYVHFRGGHFFIHDHAEEIVRYINLVLMQETSRQR